MIMKKQMTNTEYMLTATCSHSTKLIVITRLLFKQASNRLISKRATRPLTSPSKHY